MKLFLIAGEPSGDKLGGALLKGLHDRVSNLEIAGVGGPNMEAQGLTSLFPMEELSVMGLAEILPKYKHLKQRIAETAKAVVEAKPSALITIDSPDFCLRVAKLVKQDVPDLKIIHYVAPTVWAWRPKRAAKMARVVDHVLALFPFEPAYMEAAGMGCDFVGHPVVAEPHPTQEAIEAFRAGEREPRILVLPGSRKGEILRLTPVFGKALGLFCIFRPNARIIMPTLPHLVPFLERMTVGWPIAPEIITDREEKTLAFHGADVAIAASGTVSLELAAARTPMVIAYDMNPITRFLISWMLKIDTVTLVNLVSETRHVPEFIGKKCLPNPIAAGLASVLNDPSDQLTAMDTTMDRLGAGGLPPGDRAAEAVLRVISGAN